MNPIFKDYEGAEWLDHVETEPSPFAQARIPEIFAEQAPYPISPGNELDYLDDSTPPGIAREADIDMPRGGLHMYHFEPKKKNPKENRIIYYIHGGAFMRGNGRWCRMNAITQTKELGIPVYASEYRYTPEYKYPCGLNDAVWGWDYLVNTLKIPAERIIVSGESAGGTYAMALCERLKREERDLPGGLIIISGYLDMSLKSPSYKLNFGVDTVFTGDLSLFVPYYLDDLSKVKDPEVSPIYSDFKNYPTTFFCADDTEVFVSDALIAADKMNKNGTKVKVYTPHNLIHCFPFEMPTVPESQKAFSEMRALFELKKAEE